MAVFNMHSASSADSRREFREKAQQPYVPTHAASSLLKTATPRSMIKANEIL